MFRCSWNTGAWPDDSVEREALPLPMDSEYRFPQLTLGSLAAQHADAEPFDGELRCSEVDFNRLKVAVFWQQRYEMF